MCDTLKKHKGGLLQAVSVPVCKHISRVTRHHTFPRSPIKSVLYIGIYETHVSCMTDNGT